MGATPFTRELDKALRARIRKDRAVNMATIAKEAGVPHAWLRSVFSGSIRRPAPARLVRLAEPLGIPAQTLLALTDQLGVGDPDPAASSAPATELAALADAISELAAALREEREERHDFEQRLLAAIEWGRSQVASLSPDDPDDPPPPARRSRSRRPRRPKTPT